MELIRFIDFGTQNSPNLLKENFACPVVKLDLPFGLMARTGIGINSAEFKRQRIINGESQRSLASLVGISKGYVSRIECSSITNVSPELLEKLSRVFNVAKEQLLDRDGNVIQSPVKVRKDNLLDIVARFNQAFDMLDLSTVNTQDLARELRVLNQISIRLAMAIEWGINSSKES